jgi:hypothetical protein
VTFTKYSLFFSFLFSSFLAKRRQRISAKNGHKTHQVLYSEKECSRSGAVRCTEVERKQLHENDREGTHHMVGRSQAQWWVGN